jgi:hypothetical protein
VIQPRLKSSVVVALLMGATLTCNIGFVDDDDEGFRVDVIGCEEAVAHLEACCPGYDGKRVRCNYNPGACGTTYPQIRESQSDCIRSQSCDAIQKSGSCDDLRGLGDAAAYGYSSSLVRMCK